MNEPLFRPGEQSIADSNLTAFVEQCGEQFTDYTSLHQWSLQHKEAFWKGVWNFTGVVSSHRGERVLDRADEFPGARWFPEARLNFAENLLRSRDTTDAIVERLENGQRKVTSHADLYLQVARCQALLVSHGVKQGDRVAGWLPNIGETIVAMLATTSLGAVWSSCSPDFGAEGALDRFGQIEPKVLFAADGYYYNGKTIDIRNKVQQVAESIKSIQAIIWVDVIGESARFSDLLIAYDQKRVKFVQLPFSAPLFIMYSSGTTGKPKCIVHSAGGTLLQHLKEHQLHVDLKPGEKLFYFTTCGWMMWNWLVSALASGVTLLLYDGAPFYPDAGSLIDMAREEQVNVFGTSAKYLSALEQAGVKPSDHGASSIRTILSTGSPLSHESYDYIYRDWATDLSVASISGGTDILSCFVLGSPWLPVWRGEIQAAGLGMAVEVWDDAGHCVTETKGELVCTQTFPSCPLGFWDDPENKRFHDAYFSRFANIWSQGDFAEITASGGFVIHGRSDAVLNPGGVRIGTAEIYRQVEKLDEVIEAVCIGQDWQNDVRVILFVVLKPGLIIDEMLKAKIRTNIRKHATPRHNPALILQVKDVPKTMSGKIAELAVRDVIHKREVRNTSALSNPQALAHYRNLPELDNN